MQKTEHKAQAETNSQLDSRASPGTLDIELLISQANSCLPPPNEPIGVGSHLKVVAELEALAEGGAAKYTNQGYCIRSSNNGHQRKFACWWEGSGGQLLRQTYDPPCQLAVINSTHTAGSVPYNSTLL